MESSDGGGRIGGRLLGRAAGSWCSNGGKWDKRQ